MYHVHLDDHDEVRMTRRARKNNKSKKRKQRPMEPIYKYGVEVPKTMAHARKIDAAINNTHWQDAAKREVKALMDLDCFEFHENGHERFHAHLADTLRSFGFRQTRYDNDVWIRLDRSKQHYEYVCRHVDDFMICTKNPERVMKEICSS